LSTQAASNPIETVVVRVQVGSDRKAGTDDPVFLRLAGPAGRDFRLSLAKGRTLQRGDLNVFVLGGPDANVEHAELNDPTSPVLDGSGIERVEIFKALSPIPNVRGLAELDDRAQIDRVEVEVYAAGNSEPRRFAREGPIWLGLICGFQIELAERGELAEPGELAELD
jgi:hypothetical protein